MKTSTELYPTDTIFERTTTQLSDMNEIIELPTPTCSEPNISDFVNTDVTYDRENVVEHIEIKEQDICIVPSYFDYNTGFLSTNNENNNVSISQSDFISNEHDNSSTKSHDNSNVPPKKKLRPSSLFGLTSITSVDEIIEPTSFHPIQMACNSAENPNHASSESMLPCKKPIKRPLTLNLMSPEITDTRVPNIQVTDENLVPIPDPISDVPQLIGKLFLLFINN